MYDSFMIQHNKRLEQILEDNQQGDEQEKENEN